MRSAGSIGNRTIASIFAAGTITSKAIRYPMHAAGAQADALGNGPSLSEINPSSALGSGHLLDPATTTYWRSSGDSTYLAQLFDLNTLPIGGSIILGAEIEIPASPSTALYLCTYGIDTVNGMAIAVLSGAAPELRVVTYAPGASASETSSNFLDTGLSGSVQIGLVLELYKKSASLADLVCYQDGASNGTQVDHDLLRDGTALPNSGTHELTIGARRSGSGTFTNQFGTDAGAMLGNFLAIRQNVRDSILAQDLSGWLKEYPGEKPIPMLGQ